MNQTLPSELLALILVRAGLDLASSPSRDIRRYLPGNLRAYYPELLECSANCSNRESYLFSLLRSGYARDVLYLLQHGFNPGCGVRLYTLALVRSYRRIAAFIRVRDPYYSGFDLNNAFYPFLHDRLPTPTAQPNIARLPTQFYI